MTSPFSDRGRPRDVWPHYLGWFLVLVAVVGGLALASAPSPYVIEKPGPVLDTLGDVEVGSQTVPLLRVPDRETYPTSGRIDLLTVFIDGSREEPLSWLDIAVSWFDPSRSVYPVEVFYPDGQTSDERNEESAADMVNSQQDAFAAALGKLGVDYASVVTVAETVDGAPADGVLRAGDRILTAAGVTVGSVAELRARLAASGAGVPIELGIERGDEPLTVTLTPEPSEQDGAPVVGIFATAVYDFPFEVDFRIDGIGGPSAGAMFALAIYDRLTPGALTGGEHIAGTGTISPDGTVGAIGGVVQKAYGAEAAGAEWLLVPDANCGELAGRGPGGLEVFAISDLDEAISVVAAIGAGGDLSGFARCG